MRAPPDGTVERWAFEYVSSSALRVKLEPPPPPAIWAAGVTPIRIESPGRPPELRPPTRRMKSPRPGALVRPERRAEVLHRFLHHELQAAELLAFAILAFPDAPAAFRCGLLAIMRDELRHMRLYERHLETLGFEFGDLPVNDWFWTRVPSSPSPAHFVSILGMGLEGGNLDHGLRFRDRFREVEDERAARIQEVVVADEIGHVAFAIQWFSVFTGSVGFERWREHLPAPLSPMMMCGVPLNHDARRRAGYPEAFLEELERWTRPSSGS